MRELDAGQYRVQFLVCVNERASSDMPSCLKVRGEEIYVTLKMRVAQEGLVGTHWVTKTGCLGFCDADGVTVAIHIKGKASRWFAAVTLADIDAIWKVVVARR